MVIEKLSLFLTFLPHPFTREKAHLLRQHRASVEKAPQVILGLMSSSFEEPNISSTVPRELEESQLDGFAIGKKTKQSERKQARKVKRHAGSLKQQDIRSLGVEEPRSSLEAHVAAQLLLDGMQKAFQVSPPLGVPFISAVFVSYGLSRTISPCCAVPTSRPLRTCCLWLKPLRQTCVTPRVTERSPLTMLQRTTGSNRCPQHTPMSSQ